MNLFLKKTSSSNRNDPSIPSIKNQYNLYTFSKSKINNRNKPSLFKKSNLYKKKTNDSIKLQELAKTEYSYETPLKQKKNHLKKIVFSQSFDSKKDHQKNTSKISEESSHHYKSNKDIFHDNSSKKNKILINLKKRNSLFIKSHKNLNHQFEISSIPKNPRFSFSETTNIQDTFFTSIPIDINSSKCISRNSKISLYSKIKLRKENYDAIKLKELKNQVHKFEISENFLPNEQKIEKYMTSPDRFINRKYTKTINLLKGLKINKQEKPKILRKDDYTIPRTKSSKSRNLYLKINDVQKESDLNKINVKSSKNDFNYTKTDKILKNVLKKINIMNDEVTEYLKEIALEYKKEIGEFTYYNGKGIYTNHLTILKKNDNILAFMLSNNLDK